MATNTIELRKLVTGVLKSTNWNVFYERADKKAQKPYIVYNFDPFTNGSFPRQDLMLTIDIWDKSEFTAEIEKAADIVQDLLNMETMRNEKVIATFYLENRRPIEDEDEKIRRRQLKFKTEIYYI